MRFIFVFIINIYQRIFSSLLKQILGVNSFCRFSPTCSEYAKQSINKKGILRGSYLFLLQVIKCQPWHKGINIGGF